MAVPTATVLLSIGAIIFLAGVILAILAATGVFNSSPPTDTHKSDDSKNKHKHDSDDSDHSNEQVDDCKSDDDCKGNSTKKTCNNDCENTNLNNKCVVKKCAPSEVHLCNSDDDCKGNKEKKTCDLECADDKLKKCVFNASCTGINCEQNSDCANNTYKTVCDLKKKVCDFNKSIIITGTNGKSITVDPKYALNEKGYKQTEVGCFSLDNQSDWQDALKDNTNYCKVKSITLPPNIKATTFYTNGGWDDICSKDKVETISGPNVVDRKTKDTACGFKFEKVKNV